MSRFMSFAFFVCVVSSGCVGLRSDQRLLFPHMEDSTPVRFASFDAPASTVSVVRNHDDSNGDDWLMRQFEEHPWLSFACIGVSLSSLGFMVYRVTRES